MRTRLTPRRHASRPAGSPAEGLSRGTGDGGLARLRTARCGEIGAGRTPAPGPRPRPARMAVARHAVHGGLRRRHRRPGLDHRADARSGLPGARSGDAAPGAGRDHRPRAGQGGHRLWPGGRHVAGRAADHRGFAAPAVRASDPGGSSLLRRARAGAADLRGALRYAAAAQRGVLGAHRDRPGSPDPRFPDRPDVLPGLGARLHRAGRLPGRLVADRPARPAHAQAHAGSPRRTPPS